MSFKKYVDGRTTSWRLWTRFWRVQIRATAMVHRSRADAPRGWCNSDRWVIGTQVVYDRKDGHGSAVQP